jgi:hypothetical protein
MNVKLSGIRSGERVELECSARARTGEDYASGTAVPARVWRLA